MIWPNMASTLGPLPLGDDAGGETGGGDMMGEKEGREERKKRG